ncbi:MAG: hypothetical protein ACYDAR_02590 [Thermomicrobiales bacterium]
MSDGTDDLSGWGKSTADVVWLKNDAIVRQTVGDDRDGEETHDALTARSSAAAPVHELLMCAGSAKAGR